MSGRRRWPSREHRLQRDAAVAVGTASFEEGSDLAIAAQDPYDFDQASEQAVVLVRVAREHGPPSAQLPLPQPPPGLVRHRAGQVPAGQRLSDDLAPSFG